ncbi:MAG TPA: hemerythrin domain-containing protein [Candidatus Nitrosocosmicus sp.]
MNYKINFNEPIPQLIDRLKQEHDNFEDSFKNIKKSVNENEFMQAITIINDMSELIIRHAVEEEARIMRIIMQKSKEESTESIKIMQEHNWVIDFLKHNLQNIENEVHQQPQPDQQQEIKRQLEEFIAKLQNHFFEEEQIVFPLALKSDSR